MTKLLLSAFFLTSAGLAFSAQTLQFNTSLGRATGFTNAAGDSTSGLRWGIIVDTAGDGFDAATGLGADRYAAFASTTTAQFLKEDVIATDDWFAPSANLTLDSTAFGASGGFNTIGNIAVTYTGLTAGMNFALIWFNDGTAETAGTDMYGFFNPGLSLPTDSNGTTNFGATFSGAEPTRKADIAFGPIAAIPEPSRMILLAFGLVGVFFRRRR